MLSASLQLKYVIVVLGPMSLADQVFKSSCCKVAMHRQKYSGQCNSLTERISSTVCIVNRDIHVFFTFRLQLLEFIASQYRLYVNRLNSENTLVAMQCFLLFVPFPKKKMHNEVKVTSVEHSKLMMN